jgi:hypothetical protein
LAAWHRACNELPENDGQYRPVAGAVDMQTTIRAAVAAILIGGFATSAGAATISFSTCAAGDGSGLTTCVAGATVQTFAGAGLPAGYSGNGSVVSGSVGGLYAAPAGNSTQYLTVPTSGGSGSVTAQFGGSYSYFGLYWGSMDDYNRLSFFSGNAQNPFFSVTGSQVIAALNLLGNQTAPGSNRYVNFQFAPGQGFDRIEFISNGYAFESDNHAVANVPEPGTLALFGAALLGAGVARRRLRR